MFGTLGSVVASISMSTERQKMLAGELYVPSILSSLPPACVHVISVRTSMPRASRTNQDGAAS